MSITNQLRVRLQQPHFLIWNRPRDRHPSESTCDDTNRIPQSIPSPPEIELTLSPVLLNTVVSFAHTGFLRLSRNAATPQSRRTCRSTETLVSSCAGFGLPRSTNFYRSTDHKLRVQPCRCGSCKNPDRLGTSTPKVISIADCRRESRPQSRKRAWIARKR